MEPDSSRGALDGFVPFVDMVACGKADAEAWREFCASLPSVEPEVALGLTKGEYEDLENGTRSMQFQAMKYRDGRMLGERLWAGCYVKYAFESDCANPHYEYGWVDVVSNQQGVAKIQCDDSFGGGRAVTVRICDVMEVLPMKERPLLYYKTMLCGECNACDRMSDELPPEGCRIAGFIGAVKDKKECDSVFHKIYTAEKTAGKTNRESGEPA